MAHDPLLPKDSTTAKQMCVTQLMGKCRDDRDWIGQMRHFQPDRCSPVLFRIKPRSAPVGPDNLREPRKALPLGVEEQVDTCGINIYILANLIQQDADVGLRPIESGGKVVLIGQDDFALQ